MANNKIINTKKAFKICAIAYAILIVVGIIVTIVAGPKLDINFSGGTQISYSYTGDVAEADFKDTVATVLDKEFTVSQNTSLAGDTKSYVITLAGKDSVSAEIQENITTALTEKFTENDITLYNSNSVSPTIAGSFFLKSIVAIIITAVLVVLYVGIRFKKIGGVSAALTALCALVLDLVVAFFICVIFRLQIDMNFMAVVLTILGYSLNDTIVIYDRVRENKKLHPEFSVSENMNISVSSTPQHPDGIQLTSTLFSYMYGTEPEGADILGGKTGFVSESGYCIASFGASESGTEYVCVTLNGNGLWPTVYDQIDLYTSYAK